jgi:hypothetical protein
VLTKELKPVLCIKVIEESQQEECLRHLLNLMSKKWLNVEFDEFRKYLHITIKKYQDNYEHDDAW